MLNFTQAALKKLASALEPTDIIRIRAASSGCSGVSYSMEIEAEPCGDDSIIDKQLFRVCVDPYSKYLLKGVEIDYVQSKSGSGFRFGEEKDSVEVKNCCSTGCE